MAGLSAPAWGLNASGVMVRMASAKRLSCICRLATIMRRLASYGASSNAHSSPSTAVLVGSEQFIGPMHRRQPEPDRAFGFEFRRCEKLRKTFAVPARHQVSRIFRHEVMRVLMHQHELRLGRLATRDVDRRDDGERTASARQ